MFEDIQLIMAPVTLMMIQDIQLIMAPVNDDSKHSINNGTC